MKHMAAGLGALFWLSACVPQHAGGDLPPGYPPKIGTVTATLDDKPANWDTYDYSVGAFDAAVQIMGYNDQLQFRLYGVPVGHPDPRTGALYVKAVMQHPDQLGALTDVVVEIPLTEADHGIRLSSIGGLASLNLDSITPTDGGYGHVTGHFNVLLCQGTGEPIKVNTEDCKVLTGKFSSDMQFDDVDRFR